MIRLLLCLLVAISSLSNASLRLGTFNIRFFSHPGTTTPAFENVPEKTDLVKLAALFKETGADLMGLQEIVDSKGMIRFVNDYFPSYKVALSQCGGHLKQNVGLVYNSAKFELTSFTEDHRFSIPNSTGPYTCNRNSRPAAIAELKSKLTGEKLVVIVVHFKAGSGQANFTKRWGQYDLLQKLIAELKASGKEQIIALGDFNTTGFMASDMDGIRFQSLINHAELTNATKDLKCSAYWTGSNRNDNLEEPSKLDHILITKELQKSRPIKAKLYGHCADVLCQQATPGELGENYQAVSDHCPQVAEIQ